MYKMQIIKELKTKYQIFILNVGAEIISKSEEMMFFVREHLTDLRLICFEFLYLS